MYERIAAPPSLTRYLGNPISAGVYSRQRRLAAPPGFWRLFLMCLMSTVPFLGGLGRLVAGPWARVAHHHSPVATRWGSVKMLPCQRVRAPIPNTLYHFRSYRSWWKTRREWRCVSDDYNHHPPSQCDTRIIGIAALENAGSAPRPRELGTTPSFCRSWQAPSPRHATCASQDPRRPLSEYAAESPSQWWERR